MNYSDESMKNADTSNKQEISAIEKQLLLSNLYPTPTCQLQEEPTIVTSESPVELLNQVLPEQENQTETTQETINNQNNSNKSSLQDTELPLLETFESPKIFNLSKQQRAIIKKELQAFSNSYAWKAILEHLQDKIDQMTKENDEVDMSGESNKIKFTQNDLQKIEKKVYCSMKSITNTVMNRL